MAAVGFDAAQHQHSSPLQELISKWRICHVLFKGCLSWLNSLWPTEIVFPQCVSHNAGVCSWAQNELNGHDQAQGSFSSSSDRVCIYAKKKKSKLKKKKLVSSSLEIAKCCILSAKFDVVGIPPPACLLLCHYIKSVNKTQQNKPKCYPVLISHPSLIRQRDEAIITWLMILSLIKNQSWRKH